LLPPISSEPSQEMPEQRSVKMTPGDNPISNRELRDSDLSGDDSGRVGEIDPVVWSLRGVSQNECRAARTASCASGSLTIVGDAGRDVVQDDSLQVANVNAHLESRGATEHVNVAVDEAVLILATGFGLKLGRMLFHPHGDGIATEQSEIMVLSGRRLGFI